MPRLLRTPVLATALTMLLGGCDLNNDDKKTTTAADDGNAEAAEGEAGDAEGTADDGSGGDDGTGGGGGTGDPLSTCQQCAAVNCEEETMPCATDDVCQNCAFGDPSAPACDDNEAWQTALACACEVCPDSCVDLC